MPRLPTPLDPTHFETLYQGEKVGLFTLKNDKGMLAQITNYGGRLVSLWVPDKYGNFEDVVLGYEKLKDYLFSDQNYYGALIGRYANRIHNASFSINNRRIYLNPNEGKNQVHGGKNGFHNVVWKAHQENEQSLTLTYLSKDQEEGFPGNLKVKVNYTLTHANELKIKYKATTDAATPVNLTNHAYFNLHGAGKGSIADHILTINATQYIPIDNSLIPIGDLNSVNNTPMDFRKPKIIGKDIDANFEQVEICKGYDHCWSLKAPGNGLSLAAEIYEPKSGRKLQICTDETGLQFYTANTLHDPLNGKYKQPYLEREAFCLECQHYPNSPNQENFPSTILRPGAVYESVCVYVFSLHN